MEPTCIHCNQSIYGGKGDYWHSDTSEMRCESNRTGTPLQPQIATPKEASGAVPSLLGCPSCGSENLHQAQVCYEPIRLFSDGEVDYPEGITDYGTVITIGCDDCSWSLGENDRLLSEISPARVIEEHQRLVREEFLKEARDT